MHWSDEIAERIIKRNPNKEEYVCAAGISPSGSVHIGNFRDVATSLMVVKALQKAGKKAKLLFSWDEYDRCRKIPANVQAVVGNSYDQYIGCPYVDIPDPWGCHANYAEHFEEEFVNSMKPFGIELLREMDKLGIYADVSHLNEAGFWDIVHHMTLPPVASHSNAYDLCSHPRNLKDDQIRAVIEKKGYIGINFYSDFLAKGRAAVLEDVLRHIDYIAQMGGIDVLGFGSDFDGIDEWPEGLAHPGEYENLISLLYAHGYSEENVAAIAGGNLWRLLKRADALRGA